MKFVVSSSALAATLQATGKVIGSKNTLPILDNFLLEARDGVLKVTASDLETTQVATLPLESIESEGIIAAPAKLMNDLLKEFSEQPLTIETNDTNWEIVVNFRNGKQSIPGTSGLSYPKLPELGDDKKECEIAAETLLNGISKTIFATADDELRPVMNGILVSMEAGAVTFVATDAHKLVRHKVAVEGVTAEASFILPKKPATLLRSLLAKEGDAIRIAFDEKNVTFGMANQTLVCRLIEGNYPNYNAVIPSDNPNRVEVDRLELLSGTKRVAVCSNQATNLIRLDIEKGMINLTAQDLDFSVSAQESQPCSYDGEAITIGFKSTFMGEILSSIESPQVLIELADSTRAGVFRPIGEEESGEDTLMLLMPMMINA